MGPENYYSPQTSYSERLSDLRLNEILTKLLGNYRLTTNSVDSRYYSKHILDV